MNDDLINNAKVTLLEFMKEMNLWEVKYFPLARKTLHEYRSNAKEDLEKIYNKYLTDKKRVIGRLAGSSSLSGWAF